MRIGLPCSSLLYCLQRMAICMAAVFVISFASSAQTSWTGSVSTDWSNPANWSSGVPTSSTDAVVGSTSVKPVINNTSNCQSLTLSGTASLTVNKPLTVSGNITINTGSSLIHSGTTLVLYGNFTNTGTYSGNLQSKIT